MKKEIGIIGLGRMGGAVARKLAKKGWRVVGYNRTPEVTKEQEKNGVIGAYSLEDLVKKLTPPRVILTIIPAGKATDEMLVGSKSITSHLSKGDFVINGANNYYKETIKHHKDFEGTGISFLDAGVSGGLEIEFDGACIMVGGEKKDFKFVEPFFKALAKKDALAFFEGGGAGHFVKMVHNGIEYGMMQSIAEGFNILHKSSYEINLTEAARVYNNGSIITSRLVGWLHEGLKRYGNDLKALPGSVGFTGEGEWTVKTAKEMGLNAESIDIAVKFRKNSQDNPSFTGKLVAVIRNVFGGHSIERGKMT